MVLCVQNDDYKETDTAAEGNANAERGILCEGWT